MTFEDFRYEHRILYRTLLTCVSLILVTLLFMSLPRSTLMRVIGVTTVQNKISAFQNALYWEVRARIHKPDTMTPVVAYGTLVGVTRAGAVVVNVPNGAKFEQRMFYLADIKLTDLLGVAIQVGALRTEDAKFDVYGNTVVVWIRGVPLNLNLIERGYAKPDPNPPTNIVDQVFAAYYWRLFKEGEQ